MNENVIKLPGELLSPAMADALILDGLMPELKLTQTDLDGHPRMVWAMTANHVEGFQAQVVLDHDHRPQLQITKKTIFNESDDYEPENAATQAVG